ncbi:MAG TPA: NADH:flavin oxidoreductase [Streptosporangiaceae bacterium]|nr:NADH:flavin oxidoreductase [Streptosporangiaceae bacterium]
MTAHGPPGPAGAPDPFAPARLGPISLRNRVLKAATFEGMSPRNTVTASLIEFHRAMAAGGVAMTTVSYIAVSRDGMGAPAEMYIHDGAADGLARIADVVHGEGAAISAQLGHAGAVGMVRGKRVLGPSRTRTIAGTPVQPISPAEIDDVVGHYAAGARMLRQAGFDCVELHFGHHYLISAFLSPHWNKRADDYGGPVENRARLARRVAAAVRAEAGPGMAVTAKLNMTDAVRGGLEPADSLRVAELLQSDGNLDAIELTSGGSAANQMFLFRGDAPRREMARVLPGPQRIGFRLLGRWIFREYPFEEAYFLPMARSFRAALTMPLVLLGGITTRTSIETAMAEGFEFVAMGRALLREPDLVARFAAGTADGGTCVHCNKCMVSIYSGTRCMLDHPDPPVIG